MRLFRSLRVTTMMVLVGLLPSLAALWFAAGTILAEVESRQRMDALSTQIGLAAEMTFIVHELQRERGATSVFVSSSGASFRSELAAQRLATDAARETLTGSLDTVNRARLDPGFVGLLDTVAAALRDLSGHRTAVDALSVDRLHAMGFYTALIQRITDTVSSMAGLAQDARVARDLNVYNYLLLTKEHMGQERATGGAGFAAGRFTPDVHDIFRRLLAAQDVYSRLFLGSAQAEYRALYDAAITSPSAREVARMRSLVLEGGLEGALGDVSAAQWFATISTKIDLFKGIEDRLAADLLAATARYSAASRETLVRTAAIAAVALLGAVALSALIVLGARAGFRAVITPMVRMAQGDHSVTLPPPSANEFGEITRALEVFQATAIGKARLDAEAAARAADAQQRAEAMEALSHSLGLAVDAAAAGDFSQRVAVETREADLLHLAESVNGLLATTGSALGEAVAVLRRLAEADLTARMQGRYRGAFADLRDSAGQTADGLARVIGGIRTSATTVMAKSREIEQGAEDLSSRTESQAASLEQTAATMEEMASTVRSNADALHMAEKLSETARERTRDGTRTVQAAVEAVNRIAASAQKIGAIVDVIDGIAFQTNLLALNAGVEAARAGDAGRGFAVVAFEVRSLAERCAEAARDIGGLIRESGQSVSEGVKMVGETGRALTGIEGAIADLTRTLGEVAIAGQEQASGVTEINQAVSSMDAATQQNAMLADQSRHAAVALRDEIDRLSGLVAAFRIDQAAPRRLASVA
jgi:methyl-accepting chemotaxis protein